eukprot:2735835-Rhodomonas_salina.3
MRILGGVAVVRNLSRNLRGVGAGDAGVRDGIEGVDDAPRHGTGDGGTTWWCQCGDSWKGLVGAETLETPKAGQVLHPACAHPVHLGAAAGFTEALARHDDHRDGNALRASCEGGREAGRVRLAVGLRRKIHPGTAVVIQEE